MCAAAGGSGGGGGGGDRTGAAGRRTRETVLTIRTAHISGHQRHGSGRPERALELSSAGLVACSPQPPRSRFVRAHRGPVSAIRRLARAASTARRLPCPTSPGTSPCQPPMPPTGTAMRCLKPSSVQQLMGRRSGAAAVAGQRRHAAQVTAAAYYSGKDISPPAKGHHFLHIDDFSREQLREWRRGCTACRGHAAMRNRGGPGLLGCAWGPGARPCKRRCWRAACLILQPRSCNCDLLHVLFRCAVAMLDTAVEVKARLKSGDNSFKPFAGGPAGCCCLSSLVASAAAAPLIAPCIAAQWQLHSGIACADGLPAAGNASALLHGEVSAGARSSAL